MPLELIDETQQFQELDTLCKAITSYLDHKNIEQIVSLILVNDAGIQKLNHNDRGLDKATDVLSYPMHEPDDIAMPQVEQLGDVFISLDTALRQARQNSHSLIDEVLILTAHGITHLRGFDHDSPQNWQVFIDEQKIVLEHKHAKP